MPCRHFEPQQYAGYSYPLPSWGWVLTLWGRWCCPRGWHLWDEAVAAGGEHTLRCDACPVRFGHKGRD